MHEAIPTAGAVATDRKPAEAIREYVEEERSDEERRGALPDQAEHVCRMIGPAIAANCRDHAKWHADEQLQHDRRERELDRRPHANCDDRGDRSLAAIALAEIAARDALDV